MAKITNDLNNNLRGKLGDVVYYQFHGKTCVRSMPSNFKDRRSNKQLWNRQRFAIVGKLFQTFRPALRFQIPKGTLNQSSLFYTLNFQKVSVDSHGVTIQYEELVLSNSGIKELLGLQITQGTNKVSFEWLGDELQDNSYYVLCAVYCKGLQQVL